MMQATDRHTKVANQPANCVASVYVPITNTGCPNTVAAASNQAWVPHMQQGIAGMSGYPNHVVNLLNMQNMHTQMMMKRKDLAAQQMLDSLEQEHSFQAVAVMAAQNTTPMMAMPYFGAPVCAPYFTGAGGVAGVPNQQLAAPFQVVQSVGNNQMQQVFMTNVPK